MNAGHSNLIPAKPGEVRNPNGKPPGTRNRSTIARKWLGVQEEITNPITGLVEQLTEEDIMTLALIKKARSGDVRAYRALMDSAYGAPNQPISFNDRPTDDRSGLDEVLNRMTDDELRMIVDTTYEEFAATGQPNELSGSADSGPAQAGPGEP